MADESRQNNWKTALSHVIILEIIFAIDKTDHAGPHKTVKIRWIIWMKSAVAKSSFLHCRSVFSRETQSTIQLRRVTKPGFCSIVESTTVLFCCGVWTPCWSDLSVGLKLFCGWLLFRLSLFPVWTKSLPGSRSSGPAGGGHIFMTLSTTVESLCPAVEDTGCEGNIVTNWEWSNHPKTTCAAGSCTVKRGSGGPAL